MKKILATAAVLAVALAASGLPQRPPPPDPAAQLAFIPPRARVILLTQPQTGIAPILDAIRGATRSLDLVVYELADTDIEDALIAANERGIAVRVLLEDVNSFGRHPNRPAFDHLQQRGVPVAWASDAFPLTHQKTLIVDGVRAFIMTFNFVPTYYVSSRDFALVVDDPTDVGVIEQVFDADWDGRATPAENGNDLVWSPGSAGTLLALINGATSTLDVYNQEMADSRVLLALQHAAERGVAVRVVMTYATNWKNAFRALAAAGVSVRTFASSAVPYIHAKAMLVDGKRAFVGSENFSQQSMDRNRELGILLARQDVLAQLQSTFAADFAAARPFVP